MRRTIVVAAAGIALLGSALLPGASPGSVRAASLSSLTLSKSDVPAGYTQTTGKVESAQTAASSVGASVATLHAHGWLGGYESAFQKSIKKASREIDSGIDQFRSASGAKWYFGGGLQAFKKLSSGITTFSVPAMGDQSIGFRATFNFGKPVKVVFVVFRLRGYFAGADVSTTGSLPPVSAAEVERYARIVYDRVKNA